MSRLLVPLLLLGACAPGPLSLRAPSPPATARDYGAIYDRWTRTGRVHSFQEMDTPLLVAATLRGAEFQQAYGDRYLSTFRIYDEAERRRFLDGEKQLVDGGVAFLVRSAGHNWVWADLSTEKGYWRMTLADESGQELLPEKVELLRLRKEAIENELFGGATQGPFGRLYHVRFPRQRPDGQPLLRPGARLTLRISGPRGRADLSWTLKE